ncbi:MAG: ABC transporter ATP-binding protein [Chelatococcus sp.]|uniref:ABC transporter ATP-binding protein n=1 Tax=unclassified Chelatococcus TaxID=2638111 RepID=UPI001BCC3B12|nr:MULTISPECIES: ABC transporter ATP-binding protein [unclassified Chelatococcus]CAH1653222.1 ABC transporter ATP-binding protein [Hyphomicrobiales bacterium]MBS7740090.1 ABC transporter ATP-binding protein [Chelatococcus sp. HY11]MBX3540088.1 ABC transporter ATP-binding protein [Chelatococcus sp.]MBX3545081.1 ABC transporter ATP-binding protein [Chelatococcus sp.]MCO5078609.1 ABC transporter ATP-binding protein [Chelatococcus sp.]
MSETPSLTIEGVSKVFERPGRPTIEALRDINLTLGKGEFVSIVGASGSGKSTLLRIIDGLMPASAGRIAVGGKTVTRPGKDRAMVFQHDSLLPWKTVMDNVGYGLAIGGMSRKEREEIARYFIKVSGLSGFENHYPHQLSGGMRQRVNVARALAVSPDILLLDEPFAALDAQTREIMQTELLNIWEREKKTVVLITHQIDEAVFLSDRVIVFSARPGQIREEIVIDLPRPRDLEVKRSSTFVGYVDHIWKLIEQEVRAGMQLS